MTGAVEGPIAPPNSLLVPTPTTSLTSSSRPRSPLLSTKICPSSAPNVSDVRLELSASRISSEMGSRLVVAFVELMLYLKGQVPFPPSQLRRMVAGGRKGSPHQNKLLKSLNTLSIDLPSTLASLGPQNTVTLAIVFGLGREKCLIQLSGTDFEQSNRTDGEIEVVERASKLDIYPDHEPTPTSNENLKYNTVPSRRRHSPRPPLQELSAVDSLSSQLASTTLRPSAEEAMIRQSERALSQAMACSEVEFSGNLHPMGAQIYLRAPRRFKHGSWGVRPDAARMLDAPYEALVSGGAPLVECARVSAKGAAPIDSAEEEEMIWWGWDGRLAGYA